MPPPSYQIRSCTNCGLRYPLVENHPFGTRCPNCLGETRVVLQSAMTGQPDASSNTPPEGPEVGLSAMLDNIRSAWNVGSIFRTADGLGVRKLHLCGITPTPENGAVRKTSLGAEENVDWEYSPDGFAKAKWLKNEGHTLVALEQDQRAKPIDAIHELPLEDIVLIAGNEITGIDPEILNLSDYILSIPMHGIKHSFNVEVALAIAVYALKSQ